MTPEARRAISGILAHMHQITGMPLLLAVIEDEGPDEGRVRTFRVGCDLDEFAAISATVLDRLADAADAQAVAKDEPDFEDVARAARAASACLAPHLEGEVLAA